MRLFPALFLSLVATVSIRADGHVPVSVTPIPDQNFATGAIATTIDLSTHFTLPGVTTANIRQMTTTEGNIFIELLPSAAPNTVTNFTYYVNNASSSNTEASSYKNSFIHRSATIPNPADPDPFNPTLPPIPFVIQGGGYRAVGGLPAITTKSPVANEYSLPNTRGTLAMAKIGGQPDSATDEWFINMIDNTDTLGPDNNGGFTVFARVIGNGMAVADAIAALPTYDLTNIVGNSALNEVPLSGILEGQSQLYLSNLVTVTSIGAAPPVYPPAAGGASIIAFAVHNSNPAVVTATIKGGTLTLAPTKTSGSAIVTIRDINKNFPDTTFAVTVGAPFKTTPVSQTVQMGQTATFGITPVVGATYQWQRKAAGTKVWVNLSDTTPYSGTTTSTLTVGPTTAVMNGDQFQCLVTTGATTAIRSGATLSVLLPPLPFQPDQAFNVTGTVSLDLAGGAPAGRTFYATGLPAGLTINSATGAITGVISGTVKPGTYVAKFWAQSGTAKSAVQTITFVITAFPTVAAYEALLANTDGVPVGKLEIKTTATGSFTGKLTCADVQVYSLRGQLVMNGDASVASASLTLTRSAATNSPFKLDLSLNKYSIFAATLSTVTPAATLGSILSGDGVTVPYAPSTGAPWLGNYTLVFGNPQNLDKSTLDAAVTPAGIGYATVSIPTNGLMALKGKTADGVPFTASLVTSYSASYRAYIKPYKTAGGYLAGWLFMGGRDPNLNGQTWQVKIDGVAKKTFAPGASATNYVDYTATFTATATSHVLSLAGTNANGGDNTVLVDNVRVYSVPPPVTPPATQDPVVSIPINNSSFETPSQGSGANAYTYNTPNANWTFSAASGVNGSGISANSTLLTYRNYAAPSGTQVAFIQGTGTITQTLTGLSIGTTYAVTFSAAQRGGGLYHIAPSTNSDFYWNKPANTADKSYPQGFGPVGLSISMEPWRPFVSLASSAFPLSVSQAGISNSGGNVDHLPVKLSLAANYTSALAAPSDLANPSHWTMKIDANKGSFTGSVTLPRTVNGKATSLTVPFEGVLQQLAAPVSSGTSFGQGYFLLPPSDGAGATTRSGRIQFATP